MTNNTAKSGVVTEIPELCDSIKDINRLIKVVGNFYNDLNGMDDSNTNALNLDFKKWGIRTIAKDLLERQNIKIIRLSEIYREVEKQIIG